MALKLSDASVLNTAFSRARCRQLAAEIIRLLDEEDEHERSVPVLIPDRHREAMQRVAQAMIKCVVAGEQAELTRLYVLSERLEREAARKRSR